MPSKYEKLKFTVEHPLLNGIDPDRPRPEGVEYYEDAELEIVREILLGRPVKNVPKGIKMDMILWELVRCAWNDTVPANYKQGSLNQIVLVTGMEREEKDPVPEIEEAFELTEEEEREIGQSA